ncbi:hypothetical protein GGI00_001539 [Coemansia sp. RSA 2681]|nr:hypothetical protein GGI00_001539 [Coemansia sp. RSA 2681]
MASNNFYIFHRGDAALTPRKDFLFVFPYSDNLTGDVINDFAKAVFSKKQQCLRSGFRNYRYGYIDYSAREYGTAHLKTAKTIMLAYSCSDDTYLAIKPPTKISAREIPRNKYLHMASKMDELIKFYETATADTPALKMSKLLANKNIYYYDTRKVGAANAFDKRSDEGKALIQAKIAAKKEKMLTMRGYNANDKRRHKSIGMSRMGLQDD